MIMLIFIWFYRWPLVNNFPFEIILKLENTFFHINHSCYFYKIINYKLIHYIFSGMDASNESSSESEMHTTPTYFSVQQQSDGQVIVHIKQFVIEKSTGKFQVNPSGLLLNMHDYEGFVLQAKGIESALLCNSSSSTLSRNTFLADTDNW